MVWGVEGGPIVIGKFGIKYTGGKSDEKGRMLVHVYNENGSFDRYILFEEMKDIDKIYMEFIQKNPRVVPPEHLKTLREKKLNKIKKL